MRRTFGLCPAAGAAGSYALLAVDLYCKGCGICVAECPCGAIKMEPEEI